MRSLPGRIAALVLLSATLLAAQQYTHLSGLIRDPSDAAVPTASVTAVNEETGFRRSVQSLSNGGYVIASLQPGLYKVTVRKEGFRTVIQFGVKLDVAQPARVDFKLLLGSTQETITVEGAPTPIPSDDASVGTLVGRDRIERLPLNGRGLLSLLELAPGAIVTPATRGEAGQFTANGQRPNTNYFTVDGVSVNSGVSGGGLPAQNTGGALPGMTALGSLHNLISVEALEEFRVQTSTTTPEFGRLPGAQLSLSSRSGGNDFHGSGFYYARHELLDANDWFANRLGAGRAALRMHDFGGSLGGPVRRNRTFFFLSYEGMRLRQPFAWREPVPTTEAREGTPPWVQTSLALFPAPNGPALGPGLAEWTGRNNRGSRFDAGAVRIDHALTSRISIFGRFNQTPSYNEFSTTQVGQLGIESRSLTLAMNARITPRIIFETRMNLSDSNAQLAWRYPDPQQPACAVEPITLYFLRQPGICEYLFRLSIAGVGQVVTGREGDRAQGQFQVIPSAILNFGAHQIRVGADYRRLTPVRRDYTGTLGVIAEKLSDLPDGSRLWKSFAPSLHADSELREVSAFAQDTWRIHSRLTATFGMRWEFTPAPSLHLRGGDTYDPFAQDYPFPYLLDGQQQIWAERYANLAPRAGVAFRPAANTVIRGGFGLYYDSSLSIATDLVNGGPLSIAETRSARGGFVGTRLRYGFQPDLRLPLVRQWSAAVEHSFGAGNIASLSYVGATGRNLLRRELPLDSDNHELVVLATNNGLSDYHGLQLQHRARWKRGMQGLVSYSWSHSIDNSSADSALFLTGAGLGPGRDRGASDFDVRQALSAAFTYETQYRSGSRWARTLNGWAVDGIFRARTGFPITVLNSDSFTGLSFANAIRPSYVYGQPLWMDDRSEPGGIRLNPMAFTVLPKDAQGNLGRNAIGGFGMHQLDFALRREFLFNEHRALQLRVEAFNVLNHPNFADPSRILASPLFGRSPSMLNLMLGTGSPGSGLAPIFQTGGARSLQVSLRFRF